MLEVGHLSILRLHRHRITHFRQHLSLVWGRLSFYGTMCALWSLSRLHGHSSRPRPVFCTSRSLYRSMPRSGHVVLKDTASPRTSKVHALDRRWDELLVGDKVVFCTTIHSKANTNRLCCLLVSGAPRVPTVHDVILLVRLSLLVLLLFNSKKTACDHGRRPCQLHQCTHDAKCHCTYPPTFGNT